MFLIHLSPIKPKQESLTRAGVHQIVFIHSVFNECPVHGLFVCLFLFLNEVPKLSETKSLEVICSKCRFLFPISRSLNQVLWVIGLECDIQNIHSRVWEYLNILKARIFGYTLGGVSNTLL